MNLSVHVKNANDVIISFFRHRLISLCYDSLVFIFRSFIAEGVTCCVTCPYLSNPYLEIPGCEKQGLLFPPLKKLVVYHKVLPFSCLLNAFMRIATATMRSINRR